jgi:hypothetical protein
VSDKSSSTSKKPTATPVPVGKGCSREKEYESAEDCLGTCKNDPADQTLVRTCVQANGSKWACETCPWGAPPQRPCSGNDCPSKTNGGVVSSGKEPSRTPASETPKPSDPPKPAKTQCEANNMDECIFTGTKPAPPKPVKTHCEAGNMDDCLLTGTKPEAPKASNPPKPAKTHCEAGNMDDCLKSGNQRRTSMWTA